LSIVGSIVSKKAAEGLTALVLDIKVGKAAWNQDFDFMKRMAQTLVSRPFSLYLYAIGYIDHNIIILYNDNAFHFQKWLQCYYMLHFFV